MKITTTIDTTREAIRRARENGMTIGFVPTMGYLHDGHLSLIKKARENHDFVVISIFVNPLQFGPNEDFDRYPRDMKRDEKLAEQAGVDLIFYPSVKEMYPEEPSMVIHVTKGADVLCGKSRPGHFDGVATVVMKLFQIVQPDEAYFGQKDAQQAAIIENMVAMFNVPLKVTVCPTVREKDGLALSSRNVYLTEAERKEAPIIYETLQYGADLVLSGELRREEVVKAMKKKLEKGSGTIDYVDIVAYPSLKRLEELRGKLLIAIAYQYSKARLIDNLIVDTER